MTSQRTFAISRRRLLQIAGVLGSAVLMTLFTYRTRRRELVRQGQSRIISRSVWGAAAPNHHACNEYGLFDPQRNPGGWQVYPMPLQDILTTLVVHHSALPLRDGPREIQRLHMRQRGFADISYHFVIDEVGQLYEGRPINVRGTHTGGHNTGTVGVVLLGNFVDHAPLPKQIATLTWLVDYLRSTYDITHVAGHRDFLPDETVCPGDELAAYIPNIARNAGLEFGTAGYQKPAYAS